jgi:hypothetical protein
VEGDASVEGDVSVKVDGPKEGAAPPAEGGASVEDVSSSVEGDASIEEVAPPVEDDVSVEGDEADGDDTIEAQACCEWKEVCEEVQSSSTGKYRQLGTGNNGNCEYICLSYDC